MDAKRWLEKQPFSFGRFLFGDKRQLFATSLNPTKQGGVAYPSSCCWHAATPREVTSMYLFRSESCVPVDSFASLTVMCRAAERGVLLPEVRRLLVPTADSVTPRPRNTQSSRAPRDNHGLSQPLLLSFSSVGRPSCTTHVLYRRGLYPLYVWTLPSDVKTSPGGARERPASRKCCRRSVIRRRSADLNVTKWHRSCICSMSIGHTIPTRKEVVLPSSL